MGEEMSVGPGVEMLIGAPAEDPLAELIEALRERAQHHHELRSAYLFQLLIVSEGEEPNLTLGLDLDDGADVMRIADDLGGRAVEILEDGVPLNVYPFSADMLETVAQSVEPFYVRD
jgi:SseB protein C-terminal domain